MSPRSYVEYPLQPQPQLGGQPASRCLQGSGSSGLNTKPQPSWMVGAFVGLSILPTQPPFNTLRNLCRETSIRTCTTTHPAPGFTTSGSRAASCKAGVRTGNASESLIKGTSPFGCSWPNSVLTEHIVRDDVSRNLSQVILRGAAEQARHDRVAPFTPSHSRHAPGNEPHNRRAVRGSRSASDHEYCIRESS